MAATPPPAPARPPGSAPPRWRPAEVGNPEEERAPLRSLGLCLQPLGARSPGRCRGRAGPGCGPAGFRSGSRGPKGPSGPAPGARFASLPSLPRVSDPLEAPTDGQAAVQRLLLLRGNKRGNSRAKELRLWCVLGAGAAAAMEGTPPPSLSRRRGGAAHALAAGTWRPSGFPPLRKGTGSGNRRACRSGGTCRRRRNQASALHIVVSMCMCSGPWRGPARRRHATCQNVAGAWSNSRC